MAFFNSVWDLNDELMDIIDQSDVENFEPRCIIEHAAKIDKLRLTQPLWEHAELSIDGQDDEANLDRRLWTKVYRVRSVRRVMELVASDRYYNDIRTIVLTTFFSTGNGGRTFGMKQPVSEYIDELAKVGCALTQIMATQRDGLHAQVEHSGNVHVKDASLALERNSAVALDFSECLLRSLHDTKTRVDDHIAWLLSDSIPGTTLEDCTMGYLRFPFPYQSPRWYNYEGRWSGKSPLGSKELEFFSGTGIERAIAAEPLAAVGYRGGSYFAALLADRLLEDLSAERAEQSHIAAQQQLDLALGTLSAFERYIGNGSERKYCECLRRVLQDEYNDTSNIAIAAKRKFLAHMRHHFANPSARRDQDMHSDMANKAPSDDDHWMWLKYKYKLNTLRSWGMFDVRD